MRISQLIEQTCGNGSKFEKFVDRYGDKILEICDKITPPVLLMWVIAALASLAITLLD